MRKKLFVGGGDRRGDRGGRRGRRALVYKNWIAGDADAELALPSQTSAATVDVNGTWPSCPDRRRRTSGRRPATGSTRCSAGENITVNGRTQQVSGTVEVAGNRLTQVT